MDVIERAQTGWSSLIFSPLKSMELFVFAFTIANWMQWQSRIRIWYHLATNVSICLGMQRYFQHWTLMGDIGKTRLPRKIGTKASLPSHQSLSRFKWMGFGLKRASWTFPRATVVLLSKVEWNFTLVYFAKYHHNFVYSRRTFWSCPRCVEVIIRRLRDIGPEKMQIMYESHRLSWAFCLPFALPGFKNNSCNTQTWIPHYSDEISTIFRAVKRLLLFCSEFRQHSGLAE